MRPTGQVHPGGGAAVRHPCKAEGAGVEPARPIAESADFKSAALPVRLALRLKTPCCKERPLIYANDQPKSTAAGRRAVRGQSEPARPTRLFAARDSAPQAAIIAALRAPAGTARNTAPTAYCRATTSAHSLTTARAARLAACAAASGPMVRTGAKADSRATARAPSLPVPEAVPGTVPLTRIQAHANPALSPKIRGLRRRAQIGQSRLVARLECGTGPMRPMRPIL